MKLKFFKESKKFIVISTIIFFFSLVLGMLFALSFEDLTKNFLSLMKEKYSSILKDLVTKPLIAAIKIFFNNFFLSLVAIFGGFLLIFPPLLLFSNGFVIGMIAFYAFNKEGARILFFLLPHGIFEIFALILASSFGLKLAFMLLKEKNYKKELKKNFLPLLFLIILLLVIAAIIEVFVAKI